MAVSYRVLSNLRSTFLATSKSLAFSERLQIKKSYLQQISAAKVSRWFSQDVVTSGMDYPSNVEVSYEDFRHVEKLLPPQTVPEVKAHSSYPTPSGWVPPNDEVRSKQAYLVRRTKNHLLPIYLNEKEVWRKMRHHVKIGKIEGDIWKLEADLRKYLQEKTQEKKIHTQVHEVSRCIRIRGQHIDLIADFLLERGM